MDRYKQTIEFLFNCFPMFGNIGAGAYKLGLGNIRVMLGALGNPQDAYPVIHVAGTNGKGSTAHSIAAILQSAGYRTGLFTSPHLVDFRERIRIDGVMISRSEVVDFMEKYGKAPEGGWQPSFFELTTAMAFDCFRRHNVDVAVVEVGLGGRLDATNVVNPCLSVITNISFDHVKLLGNTLEKIAYEKAGIIKSGVPVVIGESASLPEVRSVFAAKAEQEHAPVIYADDEPRFASAERCQDGILYRSTCFGDIKGALSGACQMKNTATILCAVSELCRLGWKIESKHVARGFADVCRLTGLAGRWMQSEVSGVRIICDTGHNTGGWKYLSESLSAIDNLAVVVGFVNDKDVDGILGMMPRGARYFFTQASVRRALAADELARLAARHGLVGETFPSVCEAVAAAIGKSQPGDTVFVGGSTFIVADYLASKLNHAI